MNDIKLNDFTQEQIDFVINALEERLHTLSDKDFDHIVAGKSPEWDALTLFKVQLYNAKRRIDKVDKISSN